VTATMLAIAITNLDNAPDLIRLMDLIVMTTTMKLLTINVTAEFAKAKICAKESIAMADHVMIAAAIIIREIATTHQRQTDIHAMMATTPLRMIHAMLEYAKDRKIYAME